MKKIMKRALLGLLLAACLLSMAACGKSQAGERNHVKEAKAMEAGAQLLHEFSQLSDADVSSLIKTKAKSQNHTDQVLAAALESWQGVKPELGRLSQVEETRVSKTPEGYTVYVDAVFAQRKMEFTVGMDDDLAEISFISFNPVYTLAEKLEQAGMNTVMGMGTVFVILIFISFLISGFKVINRLEGQWRGKKGELEIPVPMAVPASPSPARPYVPEGSEDLPDDLELVAVVTAAIAAASESAPSGLVVRSIRRASQSKWKKV